MTGRNLTDRATRKKDVRTLQKLWRAHSPQGTPDLRIGFAASHTIDPLVDLTGALLLNAGFPNPELKNANYNQIVRTCINPSSEFGDEELEAIVIVWRLEDLVNAEEPHAVASAFETFLGALHQLREGFSGTIIVSLPPRPRPHTEGLAGFSQSTDLELIWFSAMSKVAELIADMSNTYSIDTEALISELGESECYDFRKNMLYRQPYTEGFFARFGESLVRILSAKRAEPKKCIVVDCDNTIWGGIVGEDGVGGVELSDDYPGRAFLDFQHQLKVLRDSGIFLAINSKNNPEDVLEMFDTHSGMVLSREDVSVFKVNWQPKSENLKEIAAELNIGEDALVFVDDNPFEIHEVQTHIPAVTCVQVPEDIAELPIIIKEISSLFDRLDITDDDRKRVSMMKYEVERRELSQKLTESEFLASLELQVTLYEPQASDLARVTQLINKTNQFNVTTRRYSFEEVSEMVADPNIDIYCATVSDKLGDYGLVGVGIVRHGEVSSHFDSILMSCRVLGRGIEAAIISYGIKKAASRGVLEIQGRFLPTKKNAMVLDLFDKYGFNAQELCEDGSKVYSRVTEKLETPYFLTVHEVSGN